MKNEVLRLKDEKSLISERATKDKEESAALMKRYMETMMKANHDNSISNLRSELNRLKPQATTPKHLEASPDRKSVV